MSDVNEITGLVDSYARLLDQGDVDAVASLFEHATWRSQPQRTILRGSTEVRPVYEGLQASADRPTKHLLTNVTVEVGPGDIAATSHCYWTVLAEAPAGPGIEVILTGQYVDSSEKVDETWRFADCLIVVDLAADRPTPNG